MLFPWPGMLEQIALADIFVHYDDVQFVRRSFTRRVQIKTPSGPSWLKIPVKAHQRNTLINQLCTDDGQDWRRSGLDLLTQHYRRSPYRAEMFAIVEQVFARLDGLLVPFLIESIEILAACFKVTTQTKFIRSSDLGVTGRGSARILAICQALQATRYISGLGGMAYLEHHAFAAAGISIDYMDYTRTPYPQQMGSFDPHVSSLDLLANCGIYDGRAYLRPQTIPWQKAICYDRGDLQD